MGKYKGGPPQAAIDAIFGAEARRVGAMLIRSPGDCDLAGDAAGDRLRLIFLCCHPALPREGQVALLLREVCGLSDEVIAAACLSSVRTVAQRIRRARHRIRELRLPCVVPESEELPARLDAVLPVIYQVFSEGCAASPSEAPARAGLSAEAIGLGRLLAGLLPETEVRSLLALMLLTEARRPARITSAGEPVLLAEQDRSRWDAALIAEGCRLVDDVLCDGGSGPYALQAAIAAVHARAACVADTDWARIVELYDALLRLAPSPVAELNRAVAVAMRDGVGAGLALVDALLVRSDPGARVLARAEPRCRLGHIEEACAAYHRVLALSCQNPGRHGDDY